MKKLLLQAGLLFGVAGTALAAGGAGGSTSSLMVTLFFGFLAVVIVFQAIPSLILFFCVIKELVWGRRVKEASIPSQEKTG